MRVATGRSKPTLRRQLKGNWVELESVDGETYFANIVTKETSWDMPAEACEDTLEKENDASGQTMIPAANKLTEREEKGKRSTAPLRPIAHNTNRPSADTVNETKLHDQSVAALNDLPALSFMQSPDHSHPPSITAPLPMPYNMSAPGPVHLQAQKATGNAREKPNNMSNNVLNVSNVLDGTVMGASFVGRESDAISDLAALADLNDMTTMQSTSPRAAEHTELSHFQQEHQQPMDEMYGVGIILEQMQQGTGIIVEKVFEGGPAHTSGALMEGDEIIAVDGSTIDGRSPSELRGHVVGQVGSCVSLRVRKPSGKVFEVSLIRGPVKPEHTSLLHMMPQLQPVSR